MYKLFLLLIIQVCFSSICHGQKLLFYKNKNRHVLYKKGDIISFRLINDKSKFTEQIEGFEDSLIVFQSFKVNPTQITHLYVDSKTKVWYILRYKYEKIFFIVGFGYPLLEIINQGKIDKETLIVSGSLITAGLLARWLIDDKIRIKGRRRLLILD